MLRRFGGSPDSSGPIRPVHQPKDTFLVFDGLDEIPYGEPRENIFELIHELSSTTTADHFHVLITSRPERDISTHFPSDQGWVREKMDTDKVLADIE